MKKRLYLFIFLFVSLFVVGMGRVFAGSFTVYYQGCNSLYSSAGVQITPSVNYYAQQGTAGSNLTTWTCKDENFMGWHVKVNHSCSWVEKGGEIVFHVDSSCHQYIYCTVKGKYKSDGFVCPSFDKPKLFTNGFESDFGAVDGDVVILEAVFDGYGFSGCTGVKDKIACTNNGCTWNSKYGNGFCSASGLVFLSCGGSKDIPEIVPTIISYAVTLLKTVAPIVLIFISIISLVKAITAGKEDEIKKAQGTLLKRVIYAGLVFFTVSIVQFIMLKVADSSEKDDLSSCLSCFLNGKSDCGNLYYKDGSGNCFYIDNGKEFNCE